MSKWRREETLKLYNELEGIKNDPAYENETARRILYHARLALLKHSQRVVFAEGDAIAIQLLMRREEVLKLYNEIEAVKNHPNENETARRILYHARLHLIKRSNAVLTVAESEAVCTLFNIEMGLAYNYSMPGRGI